MGKLVSRATGALPEGTSNLASLRDAGDTDGRLASGGIAPLNPRLMSANPLGSDFPRLTPWADGFRRWRG